MYLTKDKMYDVYKGEWLDDEPQGKGMYYYHQSKIIIEGIFSNGAPLSTGFYRIKYENGEVYEG